MLHSHRADHANIFESHCEAGIASCLRNICLFIQFACREFIQQGQEQQAQCAAQADESEERVNQKKQHKKNWGPGNIEQQRT
ncbi:hypothetical protein D9M70_553790 [compost metagenome]